MRVGHIPDGQTFGSILDKHTADEALTLSNRLKDVFYRVSFGDIVQWLAFRTVAASQRKVVRFSLALLY